MHRNAEKEFVVGIWVCGGGGNVHVHVHVNAAAACVIFICVIIVAAIVANYVDEIVGGGLCAVAVAVVERNQGGLWNIVGLF